MKILPINQNLNLRKTAGIALTAGSLLLTAPLFNCSGKGSPKEDVFVPSQADAMASTPAKISPQGTSDKTVLDNAPSPSINIAGEKKSAKIVVDLTNNVLYLYDDAGKAECAYLVASGKDISPTLEGVRVVHHVETYPYRNAPASTKRYKAPRDYGPKIIIPELVDTETGATHQTGQFIHGNNNPASLGSHASHGCVRMDNEVIKELASLVKKGDYILLKKF